jgi:hypothetical protein
MANLLVTAVGMLWALLIAVLLVSLEVPALPGVGG